MTATVRVTRGSNLGEALGSVGLDRSRPTVVVVGGADAMTEHDLDRLRPLFVEALARVAESVGAYVVDGGTDAGVMRLMGAARSEVAATFPLIGVVAEGTVSLPGSHSAPDAADPEPHHSHFVIVPGSHWGDESPWLARVATELADGAPSVTVVVNGGDVALDDVEYSVAAGRPTVVVGGTGRTADALAKAIRGDPAAERARTLAASELLHVVDSADSDALAAVVRSLVTKGA
ncbi:MAG: hypothetical protein M3161_04820 [Actinomycetota bacterium]|nr:hypothetical protein [Actinomycetota bacterium]